MSLADSILQIASIARCASEAVTATDQSIFTRQCKAEVHHDCGVANFVISNRYLLSFRFAVCLGRMLEATMAGAITISSWATTSGEANSTGAYPNLALGSQDDTDVGAEARGQWIPTTAVDQYAATLARWFGASEVDLPYIFPNIGSFGVNDLGFMAH